jgi:ABC-2 type transport system permease protein
VSLDVPASPADAGAPVDLSPGGLLGQNGSSPKTTVIVSAKVAIGQRLVAIWRSRELLFYLVRAQIRVKYKNSALGIVWSMIAPAMTLLIYLMVFQVLLKNGIPNFVIFLFSGLLIWNFFQTAVQTGTGVIVNNSGIVKKVSFPREILALASVGTAGVFMFFQAIVLIIFMVSLHVAPFWGLLPLLLLGILATVILASALSIFLAAVNVYMRDTQHLVEVLLTAWFWACPIVYAFQRTIASSGKLTQWGITWLYFLNPLTPIVMTFQRVIYNLPVGHLTTKAPNGTYPVAHFLPNWHISVYVYANLAVLGVSAVLLFLALVVFGRLEGNFAEEL